MKDVNNQTLPSITLTSGKITKLQPNLQIINIRGSVSVQQDVHVTKISSHGYSSFHGNVNSQLLNITDHCTMKDSFTIDEIMNRGHLHMWQGSIFSLGKKRLVCDNITGSNIQLVNTTAEVVEAAHVTIGDNCLIDTLYYRDSFSISPKSKVTHVIRREVE